MTSPPTRDAFLSQSEGSLSVPRARRVFMLAFCEAAGRYVDAGYADAAQVDRLVPEDLLETNVQTELVDCARQFLADPAARPVACIPGR